MNPSPSPIPHPPSASGRRPESDVGALRRQGGLDSQGGRAVYVELVRQLAGMAEGLEPARMIDGAPFVYGGQLVSLSYAPSVAPGKVIVHMDFDAWVPANPHSLYGALLEANHESCLQGRGYSLSPSSSHVIYSESLDLEGLSLEGLLAGFERIARTVERFIKQSINQ